MHTTEVFSNNLHDYTDRTIFVNTIIVDKKQGKRQSVSMVYIITMEENRQF